MIADQDSLTPDPLSSSRQHRRFYCTDLDGLEDVELEDEFYYLRSHLLGLPSVCWPRERCILLEQEIRRRGNSQKTEYSPITKQKTKKVGIKV